MTADEPGALCKSNVALSMALIDLLHRVHFTPLRIFSCAANWQSLEVMERPL